ncbi:MAG: hypothetical protein ACI4UU_00700 [Clostridia bacterium]
MEEVWKDIQGYKGSKLIGKNTGYLSTLIKQNIFENEKYIWETF